MSPSVRKGKVPVSYDEVFCMSWKISMDQQMIPGNGQFA